MFRLLAKLLALFFGITLVAGVASALAALAFKRKAPLVPGPTDDEIDLVAVMDGAQLVSTASAFRGGRVISWYAGVDLDLRDATLDPAGARLDVRTVFGGTRIVVAPAVPVRVGGPTVFGGAMNATGAPEPSADTPGLVVTGFTVFGGLQVISAERGEELEGWTGERERDKDDEGAPTPDAAPVLDATPTLDIGPDTAAS